MRIAVLGTGGVGGYFGGRLAQAGHHVTFIARGGHLEAIRRDGLRVESIAGDFHVAPASATAAPSAIGVVDLVLVGVKAPQVPEAARTMQPMVGTDTVVLVLQNGVAAADQLHGCHGRPAARGNRFDAARYHGGPSQRTVGSERRRPPPGGEGGGRLAGERFSPSVPYRSGEVGPRRNRPRHQARRLREDGIHNRRVHRDMTLN
jgi:ketopantoate reductase